MSSFQANFTIRDLQEEDTEFISGLYQNNEIMRHISPVLAEDVVKNLCAKMIKEMQANKATYQVIMDSDQLQQAGMLSMHWRQENHSVESGMIVIPEYQNKGLCKWAQFAALRLARELWPVKVCTVYISKDNIAANTSYQHMGFKAVENKSPLDKHLDLQRWDFNLELIK